MFNEEKIFSHQQETSVVKPEAYDLTLQIIEAEDKIYDEDVIPPLENGIIVHFKSESPEGDLEYVNNFFLLRNINKYHYVISSYEIYEGVYVLNFETKEFVYAKIDLTNAERDILWNNISKVVRSACEYPGIQIQKIMISPSDAAYSADDLENCIDEIIKKTEGKFTREKILSEYQGFNIFNLYQEIFDKKYSKSFSHSAKAAARSRYFKKMFKRYLPEWSIEADGEDDFFLINNKI